MRQKKNMEKRVGILVGAAFLAFALFLTSSGGTAHAASISSPDAVLDVWDGRFVDSKLDGASGIELVTIGPRTYAVVASTVSDAIQILDVTDPRYPARVSVAEDGQNGFDELDGARDVAIATINSRTYAVAIAARDDGFQVIDITDPYSPQATASITDNSTLVLNGALAVDTFAIGSNHYAVVATGVFGTNEDGVQIIDITNPASPAATAAIFDNQGGFDRLNGAYDVEVFVLGSGTYAAVAADADDSVTIIDVTNPSSPTETAVVTDGSAFTELDGATGLTVATIGQSTYVLVSSWSDDGVQIIDVTDPASPTAAAAVTDGGAYTELDGAYGIAAATIADRTYAVVASENDDGVQIINITNPSSPSAVAAVTDGGGGFDRLDNARQVVTLARDSGTYALVTAANDDGVQIIDISNPASPTAVTDVSNQRLVFHELAGAQHAVTFDIGSNTFAAVAAYDDDGVQIIDIRNPAYPLPVAALTDGQGGFDTLGSPASVANFSVGTGTYLAVTDCDVGGVQIIDVTNPYSPSATAAVTDGSGGFDNLECAWSVDTFVAGNGTYAIVAAYSDDGIQIINVTDPDSPTPTASINHNSTYPELESPIRVTAETIGNSTYALVSGYGSAGVQIINVTDPGRPVAAAAMRDGQDGFDELDKPYGSAIARYGDRYYAVIANTISNTDGGVQIADITDPYNPVPASSASDGQGGFDRLDGATGIDVVFDGAKTYALVTSQANAHAVTVIDITNPSAPSQVTAIVDESDGFTGLRGATSVTTVAARGSTFAIVTGEIDNKLQIIGLGPLADRIAPARLAGGEEEESGGGGCADCAPPTLGIDENGRRMVTDGFMYNGRPVDVERFYTPYPLITTEIGRENVASFKIYENQGPQNIAHFSFAFGMRAGDIISESRAVIELDISHDNIRTVSVTDEHNVFDNVTVSVTDSISCGASGTECLGVDVHHTFVDHLEFDIVGTNVWDRSRNAWQNYYNHGIDVTGESLNPPETREIPGTEKGEGLILVTRTEKYGHIWVADDGRTFERNDYGSFRQINIEFERFQDSGEPKTRQHSGFPERVQLETDRAESVMIALCAECADESYEEIDNTDRIPGHLQERAQEMWDALMERASRQQE